MKRLKTIIFLLCSIFLIYGCIKEDLSNCPPPFNTKLKFLYHGDVKSSNIFGEHIDHVTIFVFGQQGQLQSTHKLNKTSLNSFHEANLLLLPGTYRIICWGNVLDNTLITEHLILGEKRVHHPNFINTAGVIPTNDHLYFGECSVTVPEKGSVSENVNFISTHINFEIYISGLKTLSKATSAPIIKINNLMPQYDIESNPTQEFNTIYQPKLAYSSERKMQAALFQTLRFNDNNPIVIEIFDDQGILLTDINLKKYMEENNFSVEGIQEATISIQINYSDLGVSVSVPDWIIQDVTPGI